MNGYKIFGVLFIMAAVVIILIWALYRVNDRSLIFRALLLLATGVSIYLKKKGKSGSSRNAK